MTRGLGSAAAPPPRRVRAADGDRALPRHPDLVADLAATRPNRVRVADTTYVRVRTESVYPAVLVGASTRRVRGRRPGRSPDGSLTLTAPNRAPRRYAPGTRHSDQGVRYAATKSVARLVGRGVAVSAAAVGEPEGDGFAERPVRATRGEGVSPTGHEDFADARRRSGRPLDAVCDRRRIHSPLGNLTPAEFEQQWRAGQTAAPTAQ